MDYGSGIGLYGIEILNHFPNALVTIVRTIMEKQQILGKSDKKFTSILPHIAQK